MRKTFAVSLLSLSLLTLAACKGNKENLSENLSYVLTFKTPDAAKRIELMNAATRVVQARVESMGGKVANQKVKPTNDTALLTLNISDLALVPPLTDGLTSPLSFRIMRKAEEKETADITVEQFGGFKETGLTEKELAWLSAAADTKSNPPTGIVVVELTPEGKTIFQEIAKKYKGKALGIFVRGRLVSMMNDVKDAQESIVISGIPTPQIATLFADDINVGLHVVFAPQK